MVIWNGLVNLVSPIHRHICTIPYDGRKYNLLSLDLVVQGCGSVYLYLIDAISKNAVAETKYDLSGKENEVHVFSTTSFNNLTNNHTVLSLHMHTDKNHVKVIAAEFTM